MARLPTKLTTQIAAALLGVLLAQVALVGGLLYWRVDRGFAMHIQRLEEQRLQVPLQRLRDHWQQAHSWSALAADPKRFRKLLRREHDAATALPEAATPTQPKPPRRSKDPLELPPRVTLYDAQGGRVVGQGTLDKDASRLAIVVDDATVGWLGVRAIDNLESALDVQYLATVQRELLLVMLAAVALGSIATWLLARRVVRPVLALRTATHRLAQGDLSTRLGWQSTDELGDLARDFESLAVSLAHAEQTRRQWVADTSHELRTPLTVLRAELEALQDGVRPMDPVALASLLAEVARLNTLVDDLAQLATADRTALALQQVPVCLATVLQQVADVFASRVEQAGLTITVELHEAGAAQVMGDPQRLRQIFANLVENAVRYTNPGGRIVLHATTDARHLTVHIDDTPPGVDAAHLPRLFDRFYRVEESRSREHGGAGLGLAICRQLVQAHGGTIAASPSPLGGLRVTVQFPAVSAREGTA